MNEISSHELKYTKGMLFSCPVERPQEALREAANYLTENPELLVLGTGHVYDFDEGVFYFHLFAE